VRKKARSVTRTSATAAATAWRLPVQEDPERVRRRAQQPHRHLRAVPPGGAQPARARPAQLQPLQGPRQGIKKDACGKCKEACLKGAIRLRHRGRVRHRGGRGDRPWPPLFFTTRLYDVGREQPEGLKGYGEYGYGEDPDIIDGLQSRLRRGTTADQFVAGLVQTLSAGANDLWWCSDAACWS